jgi:serine/threonine protein kinase
VHRDIKPQNVFLDANDNLVLGDFGLVYFSDAHHTRVSGTLENVGSRDWMPGWAMGMRIDEIKPSFDIFCLGKLLWAMVSDSPFLRLWYLDDPQFNLELKFPKTPSIKLLNPLLKKCIVEHEKDCLPDAIALLGEVDEVLSVIEKIDVGFDPKIERRCQICGMGKYAMLDPSEPERRGFGLDSYGSWEFRIFICTYCGNAQLFSFRKNQRSEVWIPYKTP